MNTDTLLKYLAEQYPDHLAAWLMGQSIDRLAPVELLKGELSAEPVRADFVAILRGLGRILHVEFQYSLPAGDEPALELRMLDYWVRLYRQHRLPVSQVLVLIKPTAHPSDGLFAVGPTRHEFRVLCLWKEDPAPLLADEALLPLATLARTKDRRALLSTVAARVRRIESRSRRADIGTLAELLAGLVSSAEDVRAMFGEDILEHSTVYQEILRRGQAQGHVIGEREGRAVGEREGAELLLLGVLESRFGAVPSDIRAILDRCSLESLRTLAGPAAKAATIEDFGREAGKIAPPADQP